MEDNKARKIMESALSLEGGRSWYDVQLGKPIDNEAYSYRAKLEKIITNKGTGHTLLRFFIKGSAVDIIFKPEDIAIVSMLLPGGRNNPVLINSIEDGFRLISDVIDKVEN